MGNYKNPTYVYACQGGCTLVLEKILAKGTYCRQDQCSYAFGRLPLTCPQVPCVTQKRSEKLDLRNWLETWCRSQLPALKGVEGSCWKLRD
jgi:hypothetical protein